MAEKTLKCGIAARRKSLVGSKLNGIDYIEVVVPGTIGLLKCLNCRPYLIVYLFNPLDPALNIGLDNVRIEGGVKVKNISIEWVKPCSALTHKMQQTLNVDPEACKRALTVYPHSDGDFSTYTLRIVDSSSANNPSKGFDLLLSSISFSFKVDCPAEFDCKPQTVCPPETTQEPVIDYLSKDYASFRRLILDRLSTIVPNWKERNPADAGVMIAELLAYAGDNLSYYQDAVATEAYLGTARSRISVKRHVRLLDYFMHSGCNSRAWICIQAEDNLGSTIPKKTQFLTGEADNFVVKPEDLQKELDQGTKVFEAMQEIKLYKANNNISFYTWADSKCCFPKGSTTATLRDYDDVNKKLQLQKGDVLLFEEITSPKGIIEDKDVSHRHVVRLTDVQKSSDLLFNPPIPVLNVAWGEEDALPFQLCIGDESEPVAIAHGNVVLVDHGLTVVEEKLVDPQRKINFRPILSQNPLTFRGPFNSSGSAASVYNFDLQDAQADIYLKELKQPLKSAVPIKETDWLPDLWIPKQDLFSSNKFDTDFVVETENDGSAFLRFGDDVHGMNPQTSLDQTPDLIYAFYRIGNGTDGNVGAESIKRIINPTSMGSMQFENGAAEENRLRIRNPMPAKGGVDPERIFEVLQNAPQAAKINERAISDADYADILKQKCSDVQRAVAVTRWTGSWYTVYVTVDRFGGKEIDEDFKTLVIDVLNKYRLSGYEIEVNSPLYVPLEIEVSVNVSASSFREDVKKALLDTFSSTMLPDGSKGFFHPDNFTFRQPVYLSKISEAATRVDGVTSVNVTTFKRTDKSDETGLTEGIIKIGPFEIIQVENDPNYSDRGKITFTMAGGR